MIDPIDLEEEIKWFLRMRKVVKDSTIEIEENKLARLERYLHADEMIRSYSYKSKKGRETHKEKFGEEKNGEWMPLDNKLVQIDFMVAWYVLGREKIYNRESNRNWGLSKIEDGIVKAVEKEDLKSLFEGLKLWYMFSDLDKTIVEAPDFSQMELKEIRVALHPKVIEMKQKPELLEAQIKELLMPKKKMIAEEAQIMPNGSQL